MSHAARSPTRGGETSRGPDISEIALARVSKVGCVRIPAGVRVLPHELATAHRLSRVGIDVAFNEIVHGDHVKNIDITINGDLWEIKSPQGSSKNTIAHQWARAKAQGSERLILDMARTSLDDDAVLAELRRRLAGSTQVISVLHVARDGTITHLMRT